MKINGREYPLWSQFVKNKERWIGGILEDFGDRLDRQLGFKSCKTEIIDIRLRPNGEEFAFFEVAGKDFSCGFSTDSGGITSGEEGYITFRGYAGHTWRIKSKSTGYTNK